MSLSPPEVQFFSEVVKITLSPTVGRGKMENLVLPRKLRHRRDLPIWTKMAGFIDDAALRLAFGRRLSCRTA